MRAAQPRALEGTTTLPGMEHRHVRLRHRTGDAKLKLLPRPCSDQGWFVTALHEAIQRA